MSRHGKSPATGGSFVNPIDRMRGGHQSEEEQDDTQEGGGERSDGTWLVCVNDHAERVEDPTDTPALYCPKCGERRQIERSDHEAIAQDF